MTIRFQSSSFEKYPLEIMGESYHLSALNNIVGLIDDTENIYRDDTFLANLILENNNPADPNAVRIDIDDQVVGYLSKSNAIKYRNALLSIGKPDEIGQCYEAIY